MLFFSVIFHFGPLSNFWGKFNCWFLEFDLKYSFTIFKFGRILRIRMSRSFDDNTNYRGGGGPVSPVGDGDALFQVLLAAASLHVVLALSEGALNPQAQLGRPRARGARARARERGGAGARGGLRDLGLHRKGVKVAAAGPRGLDCGLTWNGHADSGGPGACCELSGGRLQSSLRPTHRASVVRGGARSRASC